ncbi:preprotein translocase subunit YajC [candidate division WOR-3 bacterium]|nr:preprotein translocase subunit YajC [candidate division WOR-3 bacterium]
MFGIALGQTPAASTAPAAPSGGMNSILGFLPIILIFAVLYFLMILPQQRRQKKHAQMLEQIKRGDRVVLASGIHGIVSNVREQTFLIKVAENTELEVDKSAVSYKFGTQK